MSFSKALYDVAVFSMLAAARLARPFNRRARQWLDGRRGWRRFLIENRSAESRWVWFHCASLGEFEQGRPVIEAWRARFPDQKIALTFFSPSGFEIRKNWPGADLVAYLPADTARNARDFLDILQPEMAVFVKYEFWANHLFELKKRGIPTFLIAGLFRQNQPFFKPYGGLWRAMLGCFDHVFCQNEASETLLEGIGFERVTTVGDPRIDRVLKISSEAKPIETVDFFLQKRHCIVAGSTWPPDEKALAEAMQLPENQRFALIIAPHDISESRLAEIEAQFAGAVRFSRLARALGDGQMALPSAMALIIDNVGMLSSLYRYGKFAFVGGGFGSGIHNTLEPAAFGLPVAFGPKFRKFEEARKLVEWGGFFSAKNASELTLIIEALGEEPFFEKASAEVKRYLERNKGATEKIMAHLAAQFSAEKV